MVLAGVAGFRIGMAVAFPGRLSRIDSAVAAGRGAGVAMAGVILMLLVAGLLEGIGRQTILVERSAERRGGKECVRRVDLGGRRILKNKTIDSTTCTKLNTDLTRYNVLPK